MQELFEQIITLLSSISSQIEIKENSKLCNMTDEEALQFHKNESITLDKVLLGLIEIVGITLQLNNSNINGIIQTMFENYIIECDKNIENLKIFVNKGLLDNFTDIPNFLNQQMELTEPKMKQLLKKLMNLYNWVKDNKVTFQIEIFEKLLKLIIDLIIRIKNCKIIKD